MNTQRERSTGILLVDSHTVLRAGLRLFLDRQSGLRVIGEAADRDTARAIATAEQPDVVLLGLNLGGDSGLDLMPELQAAAPEARVIVLTGVRDPEAHRRAVMLGAMGLVLKEQPIETVLKAINAVTAGEVWLERRMIASVLNQRAPAKQNGTTDSNTANIGTLTDRERELIRLLGEGLRNNQIAERMSISESTVRHHLTSIFAKLGLKDRFELVVYAYRHGLAEMPR
jgi:DNA-binding NarL/FixJ family response regulator